jgi:glycosyltransferase involved in cell wall biosynthesis
MRTELVAGGFQAEKISTIANGVDAVRFAPGDRRAAREALGLPVDAICIGIAGRFGPFKRHLELIEAFEAIATTIPTAHLLIAGGGGSEEAAVTARAEGSAVRQRIHLLGFLSDPRSCYHALDLLAIPSVNEGLSNVALEAMACGVPALVRAGCGHEEIITSGTDGWIDALDTSATLATRLTEILLDPGQVVACGAKAREKVKSHFSLDSMFNAYESLYRACAPAPR